MTARAFVFKDFKFDPVSNSLKLNYALDDYEFTETFIFDAKLNIDTSSQSIISAFKVLHLIAGVSYLKIYPFAKIQYSDYELTNTQADFYHKLYQNGLAEFAYRNNLDLTESLVFPSCSANQHSEPDSGATRIKAINKEATSIKPLVLIGGGKDSLVSVEAIKANTDKACLFALNPAKPILDCIEKSSLSSLIVKRQLDPLLFELNEKGALNGHVPITAIVSSVAYICAISGGFTDVITSNESSANEATVVNNGQEINHQYSKSLEFESDFSNFIQQQTQTQINYFSLLRQFTEMQIVREFVKTDEYDSVFTSCNRAFRIFREKSKQRWCLECPKCHFVHLMFAVSGARFERLEAIFSGNPLTQEDNLESYRQLVGLTETKPWECVGEVLESATAIYALSLKPESANFILVVKLMPEILKRFSISELESAYNQMSDLRSQHNIPQQYLGYFND
ncbi:hypothetical protein XM47_07515 [Catenovulum maritimum]|uniref:UDP-N-acetyl-alpha-D-muramoyl-L-alanyl-L-glutamate epimerase n=1 Tax=Catenovulum maritimum TaxID=1513271 RepID=A0A0J8GSX0_9ALTE|nr:hypothetical protein XM47_07515 [Catenovulum maritimum]